MYSKRGDYVHTTYVQKYVEAARTHVDMCRVAGSLVAATPHTCQRKTLRPLYMDYMALRALTNGAASHAASALPAPLPWAAGGRAYWGRVARAACSPPAARGAGPRGRVTYKP